jgi:hypothetical protein
MVGKLQGLQQGAQAIEQGKINIDKSKLELVNQGLDYMTKEINSLPPDATPQHIFKVLQGAVNQKYLTPEMYSQAVKEIPTDQKDIQAFKDRYIARALHAKEALEYYAGQQGTTTDNRNIYQTRSSPRPGFGVQINPNPIATTKLPVTTQEVVEEGPNRGQPRYTAPSSGPLVTPPVDTRPLPVGTRKAPDGSTITTGPNTAPPMVRDNPLPVEAPTPAQSVAQRFPGGAAAMPPMFEEGRKQLVEDQNLATAKLTQIQPALQAIPLMKGMTTGPLTDQYNKALAVAKVLGISPTTPNDPVALRQEVNKKLAAYVGQSPLAGRSDAGQALAQASNPDPKGQINQALVKLTKDAIVQDRIQAARAGAFEGNDYNKYGEHRSTFPARADARAFGIDMMEPKERQDLLDEMKKKANTFEGKKFWKSLAIVRNQGLIDITGGQ